jgi:hypothetical protein
MEMPAQHVEITRVIPGRNKKRARKPFDARYVLGRRVKELEGVFRARLGPDVAGDPITSTAIRRCAETVALSEDLRARMLRGEPGVSRTSVPNAIPGLCLTMVWHLADCGAADFFRPSGSDFVW